MPAKERTEPGEAPQLRLERQLCFSLAAASRLMTRLYQPILEPLGLTYPQYVVLLILWQDAPCSISHLGDRAFLASNTLTPLVKRLEQLGLVDRSRDPGDERVVRVALTPKGAGLRGVCACIPERLAATLGAPPEELADLKRALDRFVGRLVAAEGR